MTSFRKHLLVGIAALGVGISSVAAYADTPAGGPMGGPGRMGEHGRYGEHMRENMVRRAAELHDKLKLNAAQETAWSTYMGRMKPGELPPRPDPAEMAKLTAPERMDRMVVHMKEAEKRMEERAAATREFYAVLTPEQKKIFDDEFRRGPGRGPRSGPGQQGGPR